MSISLKGIYVENFKSYSTHQWISLADLSVFLGANSSGKSTALQTLLALKQTIECNSPDIDLLLSGKYVTLGSFDDVINDAEKDFFRIGASIKNQNELDNSADDDKILWKFNAKNSNDGKIILSELEIQVNGDLIKMLLVNSDMYVININGVDTQLFVEIHNLQIGRTYIEYAEDLNSLFCEFLNELLLVLTQRKKVASIEKNEWVGFYGVNYFFNMITRNNYALDRKKMEDQKAFRIANKINNLINDYAIAQYEDYNKIDMLQSFYKQSFLTMILHDALSKSPTEQAINHVLKKYTNMLQDYKKGIHNDQRKGYSKIDLRYFNSQKNFKEKEESEIDKISGAFIAYREFIKEILGKIFYVGPIREKPLGLYNIGFETIPKYVGTTGAYFASVLLYENKEKEYLLPNHSVERTFLWDALDEWAYHLKVASEIHVERRNSFGYSVTVENTQNKKSDIMNVGIGTSQVLPVLITGLLSENNETLIFEQPELHLHPYSQSRLADFFVMLAKNRRRVIVETHSEYMILRLRYHILTEHLGEDQLVINFFQNKSGTKVELACLNSFGHFDYPNDFKDETQELINDLMNAALMKGKKNEESTD